VWPHQISEVGKFQTTAAKFSQLLCTKNHENLSIFDEVNANKKGDVFMPRSVEAFFSQVGSKFIALIITTTYQLH